MSNRNSNAGTGADSSTPDEVTMSSQTIAKPNVSCLLPITDAERTFMKECCIHPHYYDGKEIAAKILTEDSEGSFLDPEDLLRLSDVLYRYVKGNGG
jgi:predicted transcriptional regulator of viral defense system